MDTLEQPVVKTPRLAQRIERAKDASFAKLEKKTSELPGFVGQSARWCWARKNGARLIAATSVAAGVTWGIVDHFNIGAPITGAIAATLTVQGAVHTSLKNGFGRIAATLLGVGIAIAMITYVGITPISIAVIVAVSLIAEKLVGLSKDGAGGQVPVTSLGIFVLGVGLTGHTVADRIWGTIAGVVIGVILSSFAYRETVAEKAGRMLEEVNREVSALLGEISDRLQGEVSKEEAVIWLEKSRLLNEELEKVKANAQEALDAARWGTVRTRREAMKLGQLAKGLSHSCEQVNSIARTMFDLTHQNKANMLPTGIASLLRKTSDAFAVSADQSSLLTDTLTMEAVIGEAVEQIKEERAEAIDSLRAIDDTSVWLISSPILSDVDRMIETLDSSAPALAVQESDEMRYHIKPKIPHVVRKSYKERR